MKHLLTSLLLLATLASYPSIALPRAGQTTIDETQREAILDSCRGYLEERLEREAFPGASAALILPDGSLITCAVGMASIDEEREMKAEDRMLSGSIGKTYFSAAALQLAGEGKLDLDAEVATWFEGVEWYTHVPNGGEITIRQLMRHQTGLPRWVFARGIWDTLLDDPDKVWPVEERLSFVAAQEPLFAPGRAWAYSDTNYLLLGAVLEKVSKKTAYQLVKEKLLVPSGLKDTIPSDRRELPGVIQGYSRSLRQFGVPERVIEDGRFFVNPQFEWCGGGFANTPADLARWAKILYTGKAFEGDYLDELLDAVPLPGARRGYGLGVFVSETELGDLVGHDGFMTGYLSTMGWFPELEVAAAFQMNTDDGRKLGVPQHLVLRDLARFVKVELDEEKKE